MSVAVGVSRIMIGAQFVQERVNVRYLSNIEINPAKQNFIISGVNVCSRYVLYSTLYYLPKTRLRGCLIIQGRTQKERPGPGRQLRLGQIDE